MADLTRIPTTIPKTLTRQGYKDACNSSRPEELKPSFDHAKIGDPRVEAIFKAGFSNKPRLYFGGDPDA